MRRGADAQIRLTANFAYLGPLGAVEIILPKQRSNFENPVKCSRNPQRTQNFVVGDDDEEIRWTRFGNMKGAGRFKQAVNQNNDYISLALDQIPLEGSLSRKQYQGFADLFQKAFESGGAGIAVATRLLAIKRPDYFVCLDSKNKGELCKAFGIPRSIRFDNYWDLIVERIIDSVW